MLGANKQKSSPSKAIRVVRTKVTKTKTKTKIISSFNPVRNDWQLVFLIVKNTNYFSP